MPIPVAEEGKRQGHRAQQGASLGFQQRAGLIETGAGTKPPGLRLSSGWWAGGWGQSKTSYLMSHFGAIFATHFICFHNMKP